MTGDTADWWAERLEELAETGDAAAMARRHGVRVGTLVCEVDPSLRTKAVGG